ncbi:MAG: hypothetical protein FJZ01_15780 [Candidatus Sericytochromatia bacterium]|nr:hypothetical protein [Candidatus Tanganyikabacteria bacterium]
MVLTEIPAPAAELIGEFLATMYGPAPDVVAHLACYSPRALILVGSRVELREDLDDEAYVQVIAALRADLAAGSRPAPIFELAAVVAAVAGDDVAALRACLRETKSGRDVSAVFVLDDSGVLGGYVEGPDAGPDLDPYLAQALVAAEFAQVPSGTGSDACLTGLELSYDRLHGGTLSTLGQHGPGRELAAAAGLFPPGALDIPLRYLPEARFSCAMCAESCRAAKWRNAVGDAARQALEAIPWHRLAPELLARPMFEAPDDVDPDTWRGDVELAIKPDGFCTFHDADRGCLIHAALGRQPLASCHQFPFAFTRTPDGVDVWTTFHCHAALFGSGLPLAAREADIRSRLWAGRTPQRWIGPEVLLADRTRVPWEAYRELEGALLDWLEPGAPGSLSSRLHAAEGFVQAVLAQDRPGPPEIRDLAADRRGRPLLERPRGGVSDPLVQGLVAGMYKRYPPLAGTLAFPHDGLAFLLGGMPASDLALPEDLLARYLRHVLFHKHFLQTEGALFTWRIVLLSRAVVERYAWSLAWLEREGYLAVEPPGPGARALAPDPALPYLQKAIQDLDRLVIHAGTYFARFLQNYPEQYARLLRPEAAPALIWG